MLTSKNNNIHDIVTFTQVVLLHQQIARLSNIIFNYTIKESFPASLISDNLYGGLHNTSFLSRFIFKEEKYLPRQKPCCVHFSSYF